VKDQLMNRQIDNQNANKLIEQEMNELKIVINDLKHHYSTLFDQLKVKNNNNNNNNHNNNNEIISDLDKIFIEIENRINRSLYIYNADKTAAADFASESVGGSILFTQCTENYDDHSKWFTVFNWPVKRLTVSPRVVIQNSVEPGNCWSFKGHTADLFIKLAAKITPQSFTIEHIPKELSITGNINSAPRNFSIYGYHSKDEISVDKSILLGHYSYDSEVDKPIQLFNVQYPYNERGISVIEVKITSNSGNPDFTCLYKVRVHGKLFSSNIKNNNDSQ
jgi:hypothetical protein